MPDLEVPTPPTPQQLRSAMQDSLHRSLSDVRCPVHGRSADSYLLFGAGFKYYHLEEPCCNLLRQAAIERLQEGAENSAHQFIDIEALPSLARCAIAAKLFDSQTSFLEYIRDTGMPDETAEYVWQSMSRDGTWLESLSRLSALFRRMLGDTFRLDGQPLFSLTAQRNFEESILSDALNDVECPVHRTPAAIRLLVYGPGYLIKEDCCEAMRKVIEQALKQASQVAYWNPLLSRLQSLHRFDAADLIATFIEAYKQMMLGIVRQGFAAGKDAQWESDEAVFAMADVFDSMQRDIVLITNELSQRRGMAGKADTG